MWDLVEADLHQVYGVDMEDRDLLRSRSWQWLKLRIFGLFSTECRVQRHFAPDEDEKKPTEYDD